ncbi:hypothetical protein J6Y50_01815 [bacterium]|nr:hypothetical protein [bacterium]
MFKKIVITVLIFLSFLSLSAANDLKCSEAVPASLFGKCKGKVKDIEDQWKDWGTKQCPKESKVCTSDKYVKKEENDKLQKEITELKTENNKLKEAAKSDDTKSKLAEAQVQITSLDNQLAEKQRDLTTEKAENKNLKAQLEAKEREIGKLKADKKKLANGEGSRESELEAEIETLKTQIAEKDATIKSLKAESVKAEKNPSVQATGSDKSSDGSKPTDSSKTWSFLKRVIGFLILLIAVVILFILLYLGYKFWKNTKSRKNYETNPPVSADLIAAQVAAKVNVSGINKKDIEEIGKTIKQMAEQIQKTQIVSVEIKAILDSLKQDKPAATAAPEIPKETVTYAIWNGDKFVYSKEFSANFVIKQTGSLITFDLKDKYKKDRGTMDNSESVLMKCFNYSGGISNNAELKTSPGTLNEDWTIRTKGKII